MQTQNNCPLWLAMLRQVPFLASLPLSELMRFSGQVRRRHIKRGEFLFFEGDLACTFYIVRAGRLKLLKITENGRELIVHMAGPGDQVGVVDSLGEHYTVTAQAQAAAIVLGFPASALQELARTNTEVAWELLRLMRARLLEAHDQIRAMATERVEQRLARALLRLAVRSSRHTQRGVMIDPPLSRYDLAQLCGTTTETVSRIMSNWQRAGLVDTGRERIELIDVQGLAALAEEAQSSYEELHLSR